MTPFGIGHEAIVIIYLSLEILGDYFQRPQVILLGTACIIMLGLYIALVAVLIDNDGIGEAEPENNTSEDLQKTENDHSEELMLGTTYIVLGILLLYVRLTHHSAA
jgi:hypothetical protein